MRTIPALAVVTSLALALMVVGGLGLNAHLGDDGEVGVTGELNDTAGSNESISPDEGTDGGFFSFVVSAIGTMKDILGLLVWLPATLQGLGVPATVAYAVGVPLQLIIVISIIQIAIQFDIR